MNPFPLHRAEGILAVNFRRIRQTFYLQPLGFLPVRVLESRFPATQLHSVSVQSPVGTQLTITANAPVGPDVRKGLRFRRSASPVHAVCCLRVHSTM